MIKNINFYFDCEFTGLVKNTDLISIGIISENGNTFYAEFTDYDKKLITPWIQKNIINKLQFNNKNGYYINGYEDINNSDLNIRCKGTKNEIKHLLMVWLRCNCSVFDTAQFISDVCHYDFVLLIDLLFENALDVKIVSPVCHDINSDIAKYYNISEFEAFDINRETIVEKDINLNDLYIDKHNALFDAKIIKLIYEKIHQ